MTQAAETLPNDPAALQQLVLSMQVEIQRLVLSNDQLVHHNGQLAQHNDQLAQQNEQLERLLAQLRRMQFGARSEKLAPDQLNLALEDVEQSVAETQAEADKADPAAKQRHAQTRRSERASLPAHLPRLDVTIEPDNTDCPCCGGAMHVMGEDVSERLDVVPAQYRVVVTHRPKYACRGCEEGVVQAPALPRLVAGGLPTEGLVARVLVAKYADHLPLYRQAQALARQGIEIDRSTLAAWVGTASAELKPVWQRLKEQLLRSGKVFVDETRAPVLDPGRGRTKTGYLWAVARDDRPWGGNDPPMVVYSYAPGRGAEHAIALLGGFTGVLQTDGYAAYKTFAALNPKTVKMAHCWAHVRRKFFDIAKAGPSPLADHVLKLIAGLYAVEAEIRGRDPETRRAIRQERSKPLVEDLLAWAKASLAKVSGKSGIAEAIRYALNHWNGLVLFLDDGRVEIDSNTVERSMRPIALNRKNALFAGHDNGAKNWAMIASLIETCKLNDVNPDRYLADVLTKLVNNWPNSKLDDLTPWAWGAAHKIP